MKPHFVIALVIGVCGEASLLTLPCLAQTSPVLPGITNQTPQSQQAGPQPPLPTTPGSGVPLAPSITATTPTTPIAPGTVGRGLPGMPGGPPVNATLGARDPASTYMRPTVIGPLECDLVLDPSCL